MSTKIRSKISPKNKYYLEKHRYYELKHFCMQYPEWKRSYLNLDGYSQRSNSIVEFCGRNGTAENPTEYTAMKRLYFADRMKMVENAASEAGGELKDILMEAVINETSYEPLHARGLIFCSKDAWYAIYRRFFWLLDKARK